MTAYPEDIILAAKICWMEMPADPVDEANERCVELIVEVILAERERIASDLFNRGGFMTLEWDGKTHFIKITFPTSEAVWGFHHAMSDLAQYRDRSGDKIPARIWDDEAKVYRHNPTLPGGEA